MVTEAKGLQGFKSWGLGGRVVIQHHGGMVIQNHGGWSNSTMGVWSFRTMWGGHSAPWGVII